MSSEMEKSITAWFAEQPESADFELETLNIRQQGGRRIIEVVMDRAVGSITMDDCGRWNRRLADFIETSESYDDSYVVEVSSPGADRLMTRPKDFKKAVGRKLKIRYKDESEVIREMTGRLDSADESNAVLQSEQNKVTVPYDRILQARQEITFSKEQR